MGGKEGEEVGDWKDGRREREEEREGVMGMSLQTILQMEPRSEAWRRGEEEGGGKGEVRDLDY